MMLKVWVLVMSCLSVVFAATTSEPKPVLIGQHAISYTEISTDHLLHAALSQRYPDLGNRYVQAVYSMEIPSYTLVDLRGVEFDFMVGRRTTGSHTVYNFKWDVLSVLETDLQLTLQVFETSPLTAQPLTSSQPPLYELTMSVANNKTEIYLFITNGIANIYKASFILPVSTVTGKALLLPAAAAKSTKTKFWLGIVGTLKSHDEASGYEYTFRLPVESANRGTMSIRDPDNIMGLNYTNWTSASSITNALYSGILNPVMAYRTAGYVTLPSTPTSTATTPTKTPSVFAANPTPAAITSGVLPGPTSQQQQLTPSPEIPSAFNPANSTGVTRELELNLKTGIMIGGLVLLVLCGCTAAIFAAVSRRLKNAKRHAYANVDEEQYQRDAINVKLDVSDDSDNDKIQKRDGEDTDDSQPMSLLGSRLKKSSDASDLSSHPDVGAGSNNDSPWLDGRDSRHSVALDDSA